MLKKRIREKNTPPNQIDTYLVFSNLRRENCWKKGERERESSIA